MNKYEFRKYNTYEEWYEVEANSEEEARNKLYELGEDDIITSKLVGQDGETELYRTTDLGDDDELATTPLVQANALDTIREAQSEGKYANTELDPLLHNLPQADEESDERDENDFRETEEDGF